MNFYQKIIPKDNTLPFLFYDPTLSYFQQKSEKFVLKIPEKIKLKPEKDHYDEILIIRYGGFGDFLFLSPFLPEIKKKYQTRINILTWEKSLPGLYHNPYVDCVLTCKDNFEFTEFMKNPDNFQGFDQVWDITSCIGGSVESEFRNVYQIFANIFGLEWKGNEKPDVYITEQEKEKAEKVLTGYGVDIGRGFVVFHPEGSTEYKSLTNEEQILKICKRLAENYQVVIIGKNFTLINYLFPDIDNVFSFVGQLSFRTSLAILKSNVLCFLGVDSVFLHFSAGLGLKILGLYGSLDPYVYTKTYDDCWVLKADYPCSPCFMQGKRLGCQSECMETIETDKIITAIDEIIRTGKTDKAEKSTSLVSLPDDYLASQSCPVCKGDSVNFARKGQKIWKQCKDCKTLFTYPLSLDVSKTLKDSIENCNGNGLKLACSDFANRDIIQPTRNGRYSFVHIRNPENECILSRDGLIRMLAGLSLGQKFGKFYVETNSSEMSMTLKFS
jgi:ADP-heptose:LPS heptosyltransferase/ribosomal protein L37AE/L43A